MKVLLSLAIGLYTALGPLCPMQLAAAADDASMDVHVHHTSAMHVTEGHGSAVQCTVETRESSCGEQEHCTLAEIVDSAGAIAMQELFATCFAGVMTNPIDTLSAVQAHRTPSMDRPPPLLQRATVVLLQ